MNKYWSDCLYPPFLSSVQSCTYSSMDDQCLMEELSLLARRAIAKFKFPKVDLSYEYDTTLNADGVEKGFYFTASDAVRFQEILVLFEWMKVFWIEYQLGREKTYQNLYADRDVKAFSSGNLISSIQKAYDGAITFARKVEEDYGRVTLQGKPSIGLVNADDDV